MNMLVQTRNTIDKGEYYNNRLYSYIIIWWYTILSTLNELPVINLQLDTNKTMILDESIRYRNRILSILIVFLIKPFAISDSLFVKILV